jgi:hypothetical protein
MLIFKISAANSSKLVSSPQGLTSQTMIDFAIGAALTFFSFSPAAFCFRASCAFASSSLPSAKGSNSSSSFLDSAILAGFSCLGAAAFLACCGFA